MPPRLPDPAAVLSGKVRASIEQVFALIHAANPTDRGLSPRDKAERYALKARLQSFLVKHHAEMLVVVAEGGDGVVSIRHRIEGRDAAHAVVAALDDDARRWVETELALGAPASAPPVATPTARQTRPSDALARGRAALHDYDFDGARELFEGALATHGVEAARALLNLLVEHLALDTDALEMASGLPSAVLEDTDVLAALALAAARQGDPRAEAWARRSRCAEAWAELAQQAIRAGEVDAAALATDALRDADPAHPALARLAPVVAGLRKEARRPLEDALTTAFEGGDGPEVDRLLPTVPADSPIAGRIRAHRRLLEARVAADAAWAAWSRQDFTTALHHARRARELGNDEIRAWVAEAEEAAREALEIQRMSRARAALDTGDPGPYLALDAATRAEIRKERPATLLNLLERIPDRPGRIDAARALERVMTGAADVSSVVEHSRLLDGLSEYRELLAQARTRRERAFVDALDRAEDALLGGDLDGALRQAATLDRDAVGSARPRLDEFERLLASDRARREAMATVDALAAAGDLPGARDRARAAGLAERAVEVAAAIQEQWQVEVVPGDGVPLRDVMVPGDDVAPLVLLSADGDQVYIVDSIGDRLFVRVVDAATATVTTAVSLRVPLALGVCSTEVHGQLLTVFGAEGALVQLATATWEVRRWCAPPARLRGRAIEAATLVADRYAWITVGDGPEPESIVYDLDTWPTVRESGLKGRIVQLLGASAPVVVRLPPERGVVAHAPHGSTLMRRLRVKAFPAALVTVTPSGDGLFGYGSAGAFAEIGKGGVPISLNTGSEAVGVIQLRDSGHFRTFGIEGLRDTDGLDVATSKDESAVVIRRRRLDNTLLIGTYVDDGEMGGMFDYAVPPSTVFVRDAASRMVRALAWAEDGLMIFDPLRGEVPWSGEVEANAHLDLAGVTGVSTCPLGTDPTLVEPFGCIHEHILAQRWTEALAALDSIGLVAMPPAVAQHWHHLRAIVALWLDNLPDARAAVLAARANRGECALDAIVALVDGLEGRPGTGAWVAHIERVRRADAFLAAGDARGALAVLDCAHTWRGPEQQALARLAAAWLQIDPATPAERFRKTFALAAVCDRPTRGVPVPPLTWQRDRIDAVIAAAAKELSSGATPAPPPTPTGPR